MARQELISVYFGLGLAQKEILMCLAHNHGIVMSQRHLQRLLKAQGLYRRKNQSDLLEVAMFMEERLQPTDVQSVQWLSLDASKVSQCQWKQLLYDTRNWIIELNNRNAIQKAG